MLWIDKYLSTLGPHRGRTSIFSRHGYPVRRTVSRSVTVWVHLLLPVRLDRTLRGLGWCAVRGQHVKTLRSKGGFVRFRHDPDEFCRSTGRRPFVLSASYSTTTPPPSKDVRTLVGTLHRAHRFLTGHPRTRKCGTTRPTNVTLVTGRGRRTNERDPSWSVGRSGILRGTVHGVGGKKKRDEERGHFLR